MNASDRNMTKSLMQIYMKMQTLLMAAPVGSIKRQAPLMAVPGGNSFMIKGSIRSGMLSFSATWRRRMRGTAENDAGNGRLIFE